MEDPTWYTGTVKTILPRKGFGFVTCDECFARYNTDVYLHSSQLVGMEEGMQITFMVQINARGQPQAVDVSPADTRGLLRPKRSKAMLPHYIEQPAWKAPREAPRRQPAAALEYNVGDSWLQAVLQGGAHVGVPVVLHGITEATGDPEGVRQAVAEWLATSEAVCNAPSPRSHGLLRPKQVYGRSSPYGVGPDVSRRASGHAPKYVASAPVAEMASAEARYEGLVSAIKPATRDGRPGFGFITSDETKELFGDDVFLHSSQIEHLEVGTAVSFQVQMNKAGRPQAVEIIVLE